MDYMAKFELGEKSVVLTYGEDGFLVKKHTTRVCGKHITFGNTPAEYRKALDCFIGIVREWTTEFM